MSWTFSLSTFQSVKTQCIHTEEKELNLNKYYGINLIIKCVWYLISLDAFYEFSVFYFLLISVDIGVFH